MYGKHWTDDELIDRLYGIGPEDGHLDVCTSCAKRWEAIRLEHEKQHATDIDVSHEYLAAQRRAIHARLNDRQRHFPRLLVPVLATLLLASVIMVYKPGPSRPPAVDQISDSQIFEDVFRSVSTPEPSAVGPIRSLFEEQK